MHLNLQRTITKQIFGNSELSLLLPCLFLACVIHTAHDTQFLKKVVFSESYSTFVSIHTKPIGLAKMPLCLEMKPWCKFKNIILYPTLTYKQSSFDNIDIIFIIYLISCKISIPYNLFWLLLIMQIIFHV